MIESLIIDRLNENPTIQGFFNGNIFVVDAPEGTVCPYLCIETSESEDYSVVATFDVTLNFYSWGEDKRQIRAISKEIKKTLHLAELEGDGYNNVRLWFKGRTTIREPEASPLTRIMMQYEARAFEEEDRDA